MGLGLLLQKDLRSLTGAFFLGATAGGGSHENTAFKRTTRKAAVRDAAP